MNSFAERVKYLLDSKKKYNQAKLARAANVSTSAISEYLNKGVKPTIDVAAKIADYFECSLDWLITGKMWDAKSKNHQKKDRQYVFIELSDDEVEILHGFEELTEAQKEELRHLLK